VWAAFVESIVDRYNCHKNTRSVTHKISHCFHWVNKIKLDSKKHMTIESIMKFLVKRTKFLMWEDPALIYKEFVGTIFSCTPVGNKKLKKNMHKFKQLTQIDNYASMLGRMMAIRMKGNITQQCKPVEWKHEWWTQEFLLKYQSRWLLHPTKCCWASHLSMYDGEIMFLFFYHDWKMWSVETSFQHPLTRRN
jgi:hypothetical protein